MKSKRIRIPLLILAATLLVSGALLLAGVSSGAQAQSGTPHTPTDDEVNAVARQLYCPVCENIPLDVCSTTACAQWRDLIRLQLSQGYTEAEIKTYFANQYGDRVLATPPPRGLNWLVYIIPPVAILAGAFILFRAFKAWQSAGEKRPAEPQAEPQSDAYIDRLEDELRKR